MRRLHLVFGAIVVVAFLLTGQYMDKYHNHLTGLADGPRMLMRSRHIYILFGGLLNLATGTYMNSARGLSRSIQILGSVLIIASPVLFAIGFFYEPWLEGLRTPWSQWGVYAAAAGTLFHLFGGIRRPAGTAD